MDTVGRRREKSSLARCVALVGPRKSKGNTNHDFPSKSVRRKQTGLNEFVETTNT
jgi:hypothetical protein